MKWVLVAGAVAVAVLVVYAFWSGVRSMVDEQRHEVQAVQALTAGVR